MAPTFAVGTPEAVLGPEIGNMFRSEARLRGWNPGSTAIQPVFYAEDLPYSGWADLIASVNATVGIGLSPNLNAASGFNAVYLPDASSSSSPATIDVSQKGSIHILPLQGLSEEIMHYAAVRGLPTGEAQVWDYFLRDTYDDDEGDEIADYCQLVLAIKEAEGRNEPLWLI